MAYRSDSDWPSAAVLADDDPLVPGRAHFDAQRFDEAKAVFTTVLADDDQNHEAWAYLGRIALHGEDADTAVKCLAAAVELRDDDSRYQTWLAQAYLLKLREVPFMEKGRYSQLMIKHLNRAIELDGENIEARATLAGFYAQAPAHRRRQHRQGPPADRDHQDNRPGPWGCARGSAAAGRGKVRSLDSDRTAVTC